MDLSPLFDLVGRAIPIDCMQYPFMQRALVVLLLISPACAALGVPVVNARMAFFSDAIGHSAFAGAAIGMLAAVDVRVSMAAFAVLIGISVTAIVRKGKLPSDTAIGVLLSASVAFGLAVASRPGFSGRVPAFLFGDILALSDADVLRAFGLLALVALFQVAAGNRVLYAGLCPSLAKAHGVRVALWDYVFAILVALVSIFAVQAMGVLLVTAMIVVPAATGRRLATSLGGMFRWSVLAGTTSAAGGLVLSAQPFVGVATGPAIVLCAVAWFVAASVASAIRDRAAA